MNRILIVEDEPDIQELLRAYLEDAGYQTAIAGDGVAALALFGGQTFDLVLLDLMLPKIDGFGVCELIRQQSQVPILMLTALDEEESQLRGFGMDIDDYVTKPFSMPVCSSFTWYNTYWQALFPVDGDGLFLIAHTPLYSVETLFASWRLPPWAADPANVRVLFFVMA